MDLASGIAHWRNGNVDLHISKTLLIPGIIASVLGAYVITGLELSTAKPLVRIALIILGLIILYQTHYGKTVKKKLSTLKATALGFIAAFIDVAVGGGWGPIGTPALILSGEEPAKAVGVIEFTEPIISTVAVISFGFFLGWEKFMWDLALPMIIGGVLLTPIAARITHRLPRKTLGTLIGLWLVVMNIYGLIA